MEQSFKQSEGLDTEWKFRTIIDEFWHAQFKLMLIYTLTVTMLLSAFSFVLYNILLMNFAESLRDEAFGLNPMVIKMIFDKTKVLLQSRIIITDAIVLAVVFVIGYFLTKKTLQPIQKNIEKQKRFIADASHELRTPIAVVMSGVEVALRNKHLDVQAARKALEGAFREMKDFAKLSNDLLDITKYDTNTRTLYTNFDISELVTQTAEKMSQLALSKHIVIQVSLEGARIVHGNQTELGRVFYNILNNALTYTEEGGSVFIHSMTDKHTVTIAFKDTGVGIAKDVLSKIFDPFFRADESRNTHGAGLGLTLAQKIVENHHGFIRVESEVGKGTEVSITLPLSK